MYESRVLFFTQTCTTFSYRERFIPEDPLEGTLRCMRTHEHRRLHAILLLSHW